MDPLDQIETSTLAQPTHIVDMRGDMAEARWRYEGRVYVRPANRGWHLYHDGEMDDPHLLDYLEYVLGLAPTDHVLRITVEVVRRGG